MQGLSMLLAMILKALGPHSETYYESDDDYIPDRVPLLKNYVRPHPYVVSDPLYQPKNDSWNIKINSKVSICLSLEFKRIMSPINLCRKFVCAIGLGGYIILKLIPSPYLAYFSVL